jgi:Ca2+/Na+ antiporter
MKLLLRLKNWQVFALMIVLPLILTILIFKLLDLGEYELDILRGMSLLIYYIVFMCWNYSVINYFNRPSGVIGKSHLIWVNRLVVIVVLYVIVFLQLEFYFEELSALSAVLMPAFFFTFVYLVYGVAKTLKTIQLEEDVRKSDIIVEMFMIFYLPIGIWWIQKRVNQFYEEKAHTSNNGS